MLLIYDKYNLGRKNNYTVPTQTLGSIKNIYLFEQPVAVTLNLTIGNSIFTNKSLKCTTY